MEAYRIPKNSFFLVMVVMIVWCFRKWLLNGIDHDFYTREEEEEIPETLLTENLEEDNADDHEEPAPKENDTDNDELRERHVHEE